MMRRFWAVSAILGLIGGSFLLGEKRVVWGEDGVALASAKVAGNWSQWRGPMRDGVYLGGDWPETLAGKLQLVWEKELGPSYSGPVSDGELVFTTETVDKMFERVTAYRMSDGEQVWRVEWEGAMAVPVLCRCQWRLDPFDTCLGQWQVGCRRDAGRRRLP